MTVLLDKKRALRNVLLTGAMAYPDKLILLASRKLNGASKGSVIGLYCLVCHPLPGAV